MRYRRAISAASFLLGLFLWVHPSYATQCCVRPFPGQPLGVCGQLSGQTCPSSGRLVNCEDESICSAFSSTPRPSTPIAGCFCVKREHRPPGLLIDISQNLNPAIKDDTACRNLSKPEQTEIYNGNTRVVDTTCRLMDEDSKSRLIAPDYVEGPPPFTFQTIVPKLQIPIPKFKGFSQSVKPVCLDPVITSTAEDRETQAEIDAMAAFIDSGTDEDENAPAQPEGANTPTVCENKVIDIPFLGQYLSAIYVYLVSIAGILAGVMIVYAGLKWMLAAGNPEKISGAKEKMFDAIIGLILAVGSYTILNIINPDLVRFKSLRLAVIKREEIELPIEGNVCAAGHLETGYPEGSRITLIPTTSGIIPAQQLTTVFNLPDLQKVGVILKEKYGLSILVTSGARSVAGQVKLVMQNCPVWDAAEGNYAAKKCKVATLTKAKWWAGQGQPNQAALTSCTHINSLDLRAGYPDKWKRADAGLFISDKAPDGFARKQCITCGGIGTKQGRICLATDPCQQALMNEMTKAGFQVLLGSSPCSNVFEAWHFNRRPEGGFQGSTTSDWQSRVNAAKSAADNGYRCN